MEIKQGMKFNKAGTIYMVLKKVETDIDLWVIAPSGDVRNNSVVHEDTIKYYVERFQNCTD